MIIRNNIAAINTYNKYSIASAEWNDSMEKLSTGLRINSAKDDASGLSLSERCRAQIRGMDRVVKNLQDGISLVQTAEGFLQETTNLIQRLRELAVQSATGTYNREDRLMTQYEVMQLVDEIDRISEHAEFNTQKILRGKFERKLEELNVETPANEFLRIGQQEKLNAEESGLYITFGANTQQGDFIFIENVSSDKLGLTVSDPVDNSNKKYKVSVLTMDEANLSIELLDRSLGYINQLRADLGAFQVRMEVAVKGDNIGAQNLQHAESFIRDADMAKEMVDYVKNVIMTSSSSSMIALDNIRPMQVLNILEGTTLIENNRPANAKLQ